MTRARRGRRDRRGRRRPRPPPRRGCATSPSRCSSSPTACDVRGDRRQLGVGARQPRRERRQVQRAAVERAGPRPRRGSVGRADGRRPRHRHPGRRPRPHLRALLPRRQGPWPGDRRHRPRPVDRPPRRHQPRRRRARVVAGGRGLDVRAAHPARQRRLATTTGSEARRTSDRVRRCWSSRTSRASSRRCRSGCAARASTSRWRRDGFEALDRFDIVKPDLVLLDVMLPRLSGIDVCRQLRKRSQVPIIMVTAKGAEIDTVVGLEVGADDYVTKPYRLRELVARMRAVLRRSPGDAAGELGPSRGRRRRRRPRSRGAHRGAARRAAVAAAQGVRAAARAARQRRPGAARATR